MPLKVANIPLHLDESEDLLPEKLAGRLGVGREAIARWRILRRSLDARQQGDIHFVYAAEVELPDDEYALATRDLGPDVGPYEPERFDWPEPGPTPLEHRPVVIGAGPAGLVAGYLLALSGYRPLVLERGRAVKERAPPVRRSDGGGPLDPESNYLFGEGGAGTFSDGKLTSRSSGPDVQRVLELFAECKGKPAILYEHRPHLGSNRLPAVVKAIRQRIEALGGEVRFNCRVDDLDLRDGRLIGLFTTSG